jgi:hypothetical protein
VRPTILTNAPAGALEKINAVGGSSIRLVVAGAAEVGAEQRKDGERRKAFVPGKVVVKQPPFSSYCTVRDLSAGGAKLAFGSIPKLPQVFQLEIPSQGATHEVELRWQRGLQVGVQFRSSGG